MNAVFYTHRGGSGNAASGNSFNVGLLIGVIFAGIGLVLLGITGFIWWREFSFLSRAEHARGLVVAMDTQWGGTNGSNRRSDNTPTYAPTFTFADQGGKEHRIRSHSGTNPPSYHLGENVDVIYDPQAPDDAQLRGFFSQWGAVTICGGLGTLFALIGGVVSGVSAISRPKNYRAVNARPF